MHVMLVSHFKFKGDYNSESQNSKVSSSHLSLTLMRVKLVWLTEYLKIFKIRFQFSLFNCLCRKGMVEVSSHSSQYNLYNLNKNKNKPSSVHSMSMSNVRNGCVTGPVLGLLKALKASMWPHIPFRSEIHSKQVMFYCSVKHQAHPASLLMLTLVDVTSS